MVVRVFYGKGKLNQYSMRCLLIIFFAFFYINIGMAQNAIGVRSGIFFSQMRYFLDGEQFFTSKYVDKFEIGVTSRFELGKRLSLNPEINFLQKGGAIGGTSGLKTHDFKEIELVVPMNMSYYLNNFFLKIETGLYGGLMLKGTVNNSNINEYEIEFSNIAFGGFKRRDFGAIVGAGVGIDIKKYSISITARHRHPILNNSYQKYEDNSPDRFVRIVGWGIYMSVLREL